MTLDLDEREGMRPEGLDPLRGEKPLGAYPSYSDEL